MAYNDRDRRLSPQRQFLVKVRGIDGHFAQKTGGAFTSAVAKVWDGGRMNPSVLTSPPEIENITVTRPFRTYKDDNLLRDLRRRVGKWSTTVSIQPIDENYNRVGKPEVYPDAVLVGLTPPDVDAGSGEGAMWELEFALGHFA